MRTRRLSSAAAAALAGMLWLACALPARSAASPALWLVQSATAKVYVFGTIHVMKPDVAWSTPAIDRALDESDDLWLEIPDDLTNVSALLPQVQSLGLDPQHPLSTKISKDDVARLDGVAKAAGLPGEAAFEPFRPWLVALTLTALPARGSGYSAAKGIDVTLRARMVAAGKPIEGFETIGDQLHLFADMPDDQQVALLHALLVAPAKQSQDNASAIDKLVGLWESGDIERVADYQRSMNAADPTMAKSLLTTRNAHWAQQLDRRLHRAGTSFVAVGMLHLAGDGSLLDDLAKMGYSVTRIE